MMISPVWRSRVLRGYVFLAFFLASPLLPSAASPALAQADHPAFFDVYSESYGDFFRRQATDSSRLRLGWAFNEWLAPYATLGLEWSAPTHGTEIRRPDPWSYGYGGAGLRLGLPPVQIYLESRLRKYADEKKHNGREEHRALLVLSYWWDHLMNSEDPRKRWFVDFYSETLVTTVDRDNLTHTGYVRFGVRQALGERDWLDWHMRPYWARDRHGYLGNNREEWETGSRWLHGWGALTTALGGGYVLSTRPPLPRENYIYQPRRRDGWRWYVIFGGRL